MSSSAPDDPLTPDLPTVGTRRPTVPAIDEMIGVDIPCLDHGFVRLVDYMGDDHAVVQAARVSYGRGTRRAREDRGLIRYLLRHRHTTPFEMCELKVHVKLPIFVARQWIRHRTACLTGDTKLYFDLPNAVRRGGRSRHARSLADLHRLWHEGSTHPIMKKKPTFIERIDPERWYSVPELAILVERSEENVRTYAVQNRIAHRRVKQSDPRKPQIFIQGSAYIEWARAVPMARVRIRKRLERAMLRQCDERTGEITHTRITDIWSTGTRPVFKVTLEDGKQLTMTKDHRCLTSNGWRTLEEATGLRLREGGGVNWRPADCPAFAINGIPPHRDPDWLRARRAEGLDLEGIAVQAGMSTHTIRKSLKKWGLQYSPAERGRLSGLSQRGQRRTFARPVVHTPEGLDSIRAARSGEKSNFWKGGVTDERANIGRWTREHASRTHKRFNFRCALCGGQERLCAHHLDPVWNNPGRGMDEDNLISLCSPCHRRLHARNLEIALLFAVSAGSPLFEFWSLHPNAAPRPVAKTTTPARKLIRSWARIAKIEYAGEQPTFDLSVEGPDHNFVANGLIVHNSVNEYSARYSILDREFYTPDAAILAGQSDTNRQGRGDVVTGARADEILRMLSEDAETAYAHYESLLGMPSAANATGEQLEAAGAPAPEGIARELARINLPVSFYTQWYWKIDLHNLLRFISLRADAHAQYEIRVYAEALAELTRRWVPDVYEAFVDYQMEGASLSRMEIAALRAVLAGQQPDLAALGMSAREQVEFKERFGI